MRCVAIIFVNFFIIFLEKSEAAGKKFTYQGKHCYIRVTVEGATSAWTAWRGASRFNSGATTLPHLYRCL